MQDNNQLLCDLIDDNLEPQNRMEYRSIMTQLTEFVDGVYYKDDSKAVYKDIQNLTDLYVKSVDNIIQALSLSFAIGVDNSVVLVQQNEVIAGSIFLDEFVANSSGCSEDNDEIYGYLIVAYVFSECDMDTIEKKFLSANKQNIQSVIDKQNERYNLLTQYTQYVDIDFIMRRNKAVSAISGGYATNKDWAEYKSWLPDCYFRSDVLWHT